MKPNTFIRLFYIFQFFFDFIFIYAVEKLFILSRGMNLTQIGILLFLWSVMSLLFEVPTGILADRWSRRKMLILSGLFFSTCYTIWIFSNSFSIFLLGFMFRTLGATFASGTLQAYLFDYLKSHDLSNDFEKILGKGNALRTLGIGTAVAFGGFFSQISYNFALIASAISILTISVIAFLWPEIKPITPTGEENYWHFLRNSIDTVRKSRVLLKIVLFSAIVLAIFANLEEFNDVYLKFLGFPNSIIGLIFAVATIGQSIASFYAHKFKNHAWKVLNIITIIGAVVLLLAAFVKNPLMAIGILFLGILLEFSNVLNEGAIQREIEPHQRATVASLNKFVMNVLPFQLLFGIIANTYRLQLSYLFFGLAILTYFLFLPFLNRNKN
jgi:predicted MFS family arabinose efflux permease